jgi:quinol monooxygenase YgiN
LGLALAVALIAIRLRRCRNTAKKRPNFIRVAELQINPSHIDDFKVALREGIESTIRKETGVLALYAVSEKDQPSRIKLFEMYADEQAYELHRKTTHYKKFFETTQHMVVSRNLLDMDVIALYSKVVM